MAKILRSQRDKTNQMFEFETLTSEGPERVFAQLRLAVTVDDDLFGTRAVDNQVKMISSRKVDEERHSADLKEDALFIFVLSVH